MVETPMIIHDYSRISPIRRENRKFSEYNFYDYGRIFIGGIIGGKVDISLP